MPYRRISLYAAMLAAAGIPLYIHLPQFAVAEYGISLAAVGMLLLAIRVIDLAQDPGIGWLIDRWEGGQRHLAWLAGIGMAAGFVMLFSLRPEGAGVGWLVIALLLLFTAYSLATILFYTQGVALAEAAEEGAHLRLAGFREAGLLGGVILATLLPDLLGIAVGDAAYRAYGWCLAVLSLGVTFVTRKLWLVRRRTLPRPSLSELVAGGQGRLLMIALVNALPLGITSTLFVFFVEDRLQLPGLSGLFLLLFFVAAGASAPVWSQLAQSHGARRVLVWGMALAILAFCSAALLPEGAAARFALISFLSGAALGADMVILPAIFAGSLARSGLTAGAAFGLWAFAGKASLALAAAAVFPFLGATGFVPGGANSAGALTALALAYAVLPCLLKMLAIVMVRSLPDQVALS